MNDLNELIVLKKFIDYPTEKNLLEAMNGIEEIEMNEDMNAFIQNYRELNFKEWEEIYTKTFDMNGVCCLDTGYILFGEDYKRGEFLVGLKDLYRRVGYVCGTELPDHLPYLLEAILLMPEGTEKNDLATKILIPSVQKMIHSFQGISGSQSLFKIPLEEINKILQNKFIIGQRGLA